MSTLRVAAVLAAFSCATVSVSVISASAWAQSTAPTPPNPGAAPAAPAAPAAAAGKAAAAAPSAPAGSVAATPPNPGAAPSAAAAPPAPANPETVVARVGGEEIHLSDVQEGAANVPAEYHQLPPQVLFPMVLDQLVDRRAVAVYARKQGIDKDPAVQKAMQRAAEGALENAAVGRVVRPQITDAAIKAKYEATYASKPGEEEVHARHILVASEDEAKKIIDELHKGADFATLAKARSTDPGKEQGGDLGWFKKGDMLPEFSDAAFALKPGQITETPVHTRYGWHVIKLEDRRTAQPPSFEQSRDEIRQQLIQAAVQDFVKQAKTGIAIEKFNPDGSPAKATDLAVPPGAAAAGGTDTPPTGTPPAGGSGTPAPAPAQ